MNMKKYLKKNQYWNDKNLWFNYEENMKYEIFLFEETNQKELMSKNYKKNCRLLTYIDHLW